MKRERGRNRNGGERLVGKKERKCGRGIERGRRVKGKNKASREEEEEKIRDIERQEDEDGEGR